MLPIIFMDLVDESDIPAFEKLYESNKDKAYKTAYRIIEDSTLAEDCVSEVFLAIARKFQKVNKLNTDEQSKYIVSSIRNRAVNIIKKEKISRESISYDDTILSSNSFSELKLIELKEIANQLNKTDLEIIYWKDIRGIDYKTIADSFGISYAAAKQRHWTAKNNLQKLLSAEGEQNV